MAKGRSIRPLYLQIVFVILAFSLMVVTSGIFVNIRLADYLKRDAVNLLMQTQIKIKDDLKEAETLMISIAKDVRDIIAKGGGAREVRVYCDEISAELFIKNDGFIFDGLHGYFEGFETPYVADPRWAVPADYDPASRPWYTEAVEAGGKIAITPMYLSARTGEYQISVACRIFDGGRPLGVIAMDVLLTKITGFIADMHPFEGGYGFLANEDFVMTAHHEADFVSKHMNEIGAGFRQIVEVMEQGETFVKVDAYNYQGIRSIFYCEKIDNGWYLGLMTPRSMYYRDLWVLLSFLGVLGFALMMAVNVFLVRIDAKRTRLDGALRGRNLQLALLEEARVSDERVRLMLDAAPFGVITLNRNFNVLDCNQAAMTMFGVDDKEAFKAEFHSYSPEYQPDGERSKSKWHRLSQSIFAEQSSRFLWTHQRPDGELLPCEVTNISTTYNGQDIAIGYIRDLRKDWETLTAKRELEKAIKEMNALNTLSIVLNGLDTMVYVTDPETSGLLFINDNMKNHYGIEGDVIGQVCYKVFQKEMGGKCSFCPMFGSDRKPGSTVVWEARDMSTGRFYRNTDRYITWPGGKNVHLQHSIDITDLKNMTNTLDKRLEQQSLMTYISQSFMSDENMDVLITRALRIVGEFMGVDQILMNVTEDNGFSFTCRNEWINPKLGYSSRVGWTFSIGQPVIDLIHRVKELELTYVTSNNQEVKEIIAPYRVNFNTYILTSVFLGDTLYAVVDFSRGGEGRWDHNEINMASFMTNILIGAMNRRIAEHQLVAAKEAAEQSNRSKGFFLAHMSHEIRTPMNSILGLSEIQLINKTLPTGTMEAFRQIYDSGNLMLNIINDILDFSKVDAGKMEIIPARYDIPNLLNDTVQLNRLRYESKPIEFIFNVDNNTPLELLGDELRIRQILNNLLSNAYKYTAKGRIYLSVFTEDEDEDEDEEEVTLVFRVSDTGQGMRKDQIDRLFDEYSRFNMETNRSISGTGLGMSIAKRLIDLMGGSIKVESEVGKGSIFTVSLPQKKAGHAVCGAEIARTLRNFSFHSTLISKKVQVVHEYMPYGSVLIVDDIASNLYVAKGLLSPYGLQIQTVDSGIKAVEKIKAGNVYDIVFMDHMMPIMDGIQATKIIRDMGYNHPIVALTANIIVWQSDLFLSEGFDGFISKPIDSRELNVILDRFIRDKQPPEVIEATLLERRKREAGAVGPAQDQDSEDKSDIEKFFILDAENAIKIMEDVYTKLTFSDTTNINSFTIAAHGMKSSLANIGEKELSLSALRLEQAGNAQDFTVITKETPAFLDALLFLINKFKSADNYEDSMTYTGDEIYLREKLLAVKAACETFDIVSAKEALGDLRQKTWPRQTNELLEKISIHLLHSAFKKAAAVVEENLS